MNNPADIPAGERPVITGLAAATPLGTDAETTWAALLAGRVGMGPMPAVESPLPPDALGGQAADLPAAFAADLPREARFLRWAARHALQNAGFRPGVHPPSRCTAVLGTTLHGIRAAGRFLRSGRPTELRSFLAASTAAAALDGLGLDGGLLTTCSACSSSLGAIALGITLIQDGHADLVLAGGYDAASEYAWAGFQALKLVAPSPVRPFCRDRPGMKVSEGYGLVVLESPRSAARRGQPAHASVEGWGESADAHHLTKPHPEGRGAVAAMRQALRRASVRPDALDAVIAHATGTPDNDESEFRALASVLESRLAQVPVLALKSNLGHTLGAAGAVELVMACLALRDGRLPPCPNVSPGDLEHPELTIITGAASSRPLRRTLNTSLGFGGANTSILLARHPAPRDRPAARPTEPPLITGAGLLLPGAAGHAEFLERLDQASPDAPSATTEAQIEAHLHARRARRLSEYVKLTLAAAAMAVRDARLDAESLGAAHAILGSTHGSVRMCVEYYTQIVEQGPLSANPVLFAEGVPNAAAAHLSTTLGITGACQTIIGSRTAGLDALALAAARIRAGETDLVLVVSADEPSDLLPRVYLANGVGAAAKPTPTAPPCGAGAVAFVVESRRSADQRGARAYAALHRHAWASPRPGRFGGPAAAVAAALAGLDHAGRVVAFPSSSWVGRAERLGTRRAGRRLEPRLPTARFPELFSSSALTALAAELAPDAPGGRLTVLGAEWTGAATAVQLDVLARRLNPRTDNPAGES